MTVTFTQHSKTTAQPRMLTVGTLEAVAISGTEWRVSDPSQGTAVGIVQRIANTYELMQLGLPLDRYYFASLEDAVDFLDRVSPRPAR